MASIFSLQAHNIQQNFPWSKKLFLPELLDDGMLYKLDMQDPQKNDCWSCLKKVRQSCSVPASWNSLSDILQDSEESDWQTSNIGGNVFEISCFMEKSSGYYEPVHWRWVPARTLCDCPGSKMSLSILEFWKLLTMHFFFTSVIYPSGVFDGVEE